MIGESTRDPLASVEIMVWLATKSRVGQPILDRVDIALATSDAFVEDVRRLVRDEVIDGDR